ncbi:MAG: cation transporter [bacterium]
MHLIGDLLQSIGVIIASIVIIVRPDFKIVDPICTYLFSVLVIFTTVPVFKECVNILMESTP